MLRRLAPLGLLCLVACADDAVLFIAKPSAPSVGATLIAVIAPARVDLIALDDDGPIEVPYPSDPESSRLELLFYDESLTELRLDAGPVLLASLDEPSHPLPSPRERFALEPVSIDRAWDSRPGLSAELSMLALPGAPPSLCDTFERHVVYPPLARQGVGAEAAATLPDGRALVSFADGSGRIHVVDLDGRVTELRSPFRNHRPIDVEDDGTLWLGARTSSTVLPRLVIVAHARLESGSLVELEAHVSTDETLLGLRDFSATARLESGAFERFALDRTGAVLHFNGRELRVIHRFEANMDGLGDIILRGPGVAYAGWEGVPGLLSVSEAGTEELLVAGLDRTQSHLALVEDVDGTLLVADGKGAFYRIVDSGVAELVGSPAGAHQFTSILPYEGGFVAGGKRGTLQVYARDGGFCDLSDPDIPGTVNDITPFGAGFLLAVDVSPGGAPRIVYFTKQAR